MFFGPRLSFKNLFTGIPYKRPSWDGVYDIRPVQEIKCDMSQFCDKHKIVDTFQIQLPHRWDVSGVHRPCARLFCKFAV